MVDNNQCNCLWDHRFQMSRFSKTWSFMAWSTDKQWLVIFCASIMILICSLHGFSTYFTLTKLCTELLHKGSGTCRVSTVNNVKVISMIGGRTISGISYQLLSSEFSRDGNFLPTGNVHRLCSVLITRLDSEFQKIEDLSPLEKHREIYMHTKNVLNLFFQVTSTKKRKEISEMFMHRVFPLGLLTCDAFMGLKLSFLPCNESQVLRRLFWNFWSRYQNSLLVFSLVP